MLRGQAQLPTDDERDQTLNDYTLIAHNLSTKDTATVKARNDSAAQYT